MKNNNIKADICIIGAGSGGLSLAAGTAQLGLNTVLIEKHKMGGDCLNTGCVPSKALLAAAKHAHTIRKNHIDGVVAQEPDIDFAKVKNHIIDTIKTIEPNDSIERFESLGVKVISEEASFIDKKTVKAGDKIITAKYFVIATGSSSFLPNIKGMDYSRIYTNENIFDLKEKPEHLIIVGGGPIGIEMAQAHRRLGCDVTIIDMMSIMPRDDEDCVDIIRDSLIEEGVNIYENTSINEISYEGNKTFVHLINGDKIEGTHLLMATGRKPNIDGLDLDNTEIIYDNKGIKTDKRLRTNIKNIFAMGDVAGCPQFTHVAGYHAGVIIKNVCFKIPAKVNYAALPWVTYSDPELAQTGLTEKLAKEQFGDKIKVVKWKYKENDRAIANKTTKGFIKVITRTNGKILGASIVGEQAGDLINTWSLAIENGLKIGAIAQTIVPYPTLSDINKRVAGSWFTASLFSSRTRTLVKVLKSLDIRNNIT